MRSRPPLIVLQRLSKLSLFASCSRRELAAIANRCTVADLPAGTSFALPEHAWGQLVVILDGRVRRVAGHRDAEQLGPGDLFGDPTLLGTAGEAATVVFEEDTTVLVFGRAEVPCLLEAVPRLVTALREARPPAEAARQAARLNHPSSAHAACRPRVARREDRPGRGRIAMAGEPVIL